MVEAGKTRVEAAAAVGVNRRFVGEWVEAVRRSGEAVLAGGRRGRRPGEQKPMSPPQERRIRRLVAEGEDLRGFETQDRLAPSGRRVKPRDGGIEEPPRLA